MSGPDRVLTARRAQSRGLPALLPAADVEAIPLLGTSWYTRGVSYYLRRVLASLLMLIPLAVFVTLEADLFLATDGFSSLGTLAWRVVLGILFLGSFVWPLRNLRRQRELRRAGQIVYPNVLPGGGRIPVRGAGIGALARTGNGLAGAFLLIESVIFLGWFVILFLETFRHELGIEHDARLRLQRWQKSQGTKRPAPRTRLTRHLGPLGSVRSG